MGLLLTQIHIHILATLKALMVDLVPLLLKLFSGRVYFFEFWLYPKGGGTGRFVLKIDGLVVIDWTGISFLWN